MAVKIYSIFLLLYIILCKTMAHRPGNDRHAVACFIVVPICCFGWHDAVA